ncbi:MAG: homoserine dehydrogenase [Rhodobacteraceae bacterium]|nr:homoserine dehydrogenase [Paracoccaceae bacterium]MCY4197335.1 homoserine dehydrogenase [Paracoccaceae bacterium]
MRETMNIGVAGLGTVGTSAIKLLEENSELIAARCGKHLHVKAVCARTRGKPRGISLEGFDWVEDATLLASRPDIDLFVELIGGHDNTAKAAVEAAINAGKHVVTANKALLAIHGNAIAKMAEDAGVTLRFEAAVAGGIPVVKSLTESLAGERIRRVLGVMNGTCNFILTRMESNGSSYEETFAEADKLGYLESDPDLDVGGIDAGHKLALLSSIAFGTQVDFAGMDIEGIKRISITDIELARDMGYRVKLLGVARMSDSGLEQRTEPCLVPANSPLGRVENATNIVLLEGETTGPVYLMGAGAGGGPTAAAVIGDIIDIARGRTISTFGQPASTLKKVASTRSSAELAWYIRLLLVDQPGVLARIAAAFGDANVSINRLRQYGHDENGAPVLIVTHHTQREQLNHSLNAVRKTGLSLREPVAIRIEDG